MTDDRLLAAKKKFSRLLKEIFQFDCADLDFGIYRILAMRRTELERFLDDELLPQVEGILAAAAGDRAPVQSELTKLEDQLRGMGVSDFNGVPKWNELKGKLAASPDVAVLAREVFSDLTTFFARYYDEGDFMALPRYKGDTYAIPYDGSEVKLHWANADQYYIKTTEQHADYTAVIDGVSGLDKPRLCFRLAAAESDRDNNKSTEKRRYVLRSESPVEVEGNQLTLWFEYRVPDPGNGRQPTQNALCEETEKAVLAAVPQTWQAALTRKASQNPEKYTVLGYQLYRYTKKNTSDYFIHKDLGGFLRRELDFFIKNEVLFLDDIEGRTSAEIDVALQKVKAIRAVGGKIIDWLTQLEDFQKRLFLKEKVIFETSWIVPVSLVPDDLLAAVVSNEDQRKQWEARFRIDRIAGDLATTGYSVPLSERFIRENPSLPLDTALFPYAFTCRVLAGIEEELVSNAALLVHGENLQAIRLLSMRYAGGIESIFIDPPYNTGNDGFVYKDGYPESSWLALMRDRVAAGRELLSAQGSFSVTIDRNQGARLRVLCDTAFGPDNFVAEIAWQKLYTIKNSAKYLSEMWDSILLYARDKGGWLPHKLARSEAQDEAYGNPDDDSNGPWISNALQARNYYSAGIYEIQCPGGRVIEGPPPGTYWRTSEQSFWELDKKGRVWWGKDGNAIPRIKKYLKEMDEGIVPVDYWLHQFAGTNAESKTETRDLLGIEVTGLTPKPVKLMRRVVEMTSRDGVVLDYFAGSGATGEAVLRQNEADGGGRTFILVECGDYFDGVLVPRLTRANYARKWKAGFPDDVVDTPRLLKVIRLESYDDSLENVELVRPDAGALFERSSLREDYTLRYMLNLEVEGSLLNLQRFRKPWDYTIKVRRDGVVQDSPVDLVETFNYLIGLRVKRYDTYGQEGLLFVIGTDPEGRRVIIVWRDCDLWPNDRLEEKCRQAFESFRPDEFDLVYVNGDNHLPIIKTGEESWKVNLIEETFHARMFDTSDVE